MVGSLFSVPHSQAAEVMSKNLCWQTQWKHLSNQFCCQLHWQWWRNHTKTTHKILP